MLRISLTLSLFLPFAITGSAISQKMYWTGFEGVWRADLNGSNVELVVPREERAPFAISIDSEFGKVYWSERLVSDSYGWILRANLDGLSKEELTSTEPRPRGIALDVEAERVYWTSYPPFRIERASLDGSNREIVVTDEISDVLGLALDVQQQKMYWMDFSTGNAFRSNLDGTGVERIMAGASVKPRFPALDLKNGKIYWTAGDLHSNAGVFRANLDGSNPEQIVSTDGFPQGIALDLAGGKVHWLLQHYPERYTTRLYRADLSGGNEELLVHIPNQSYGWGLALYQPPEACCFVANACQELTPTACVGLGGTPAGLGLSCGGMEACCDSSTQACYMADQTCCIANGDARHGPDSVCTVAEACCLSGTCKQLDPLCCLDEGGIVQGPGTTCGDCGSCCLADDACVEGIVDGICVAVGGRFNGDGSICEGDSDGDGIDDQCDHCPGVNDAMFGIKTCDSGKLCEADGDCVGDGSCTESCVGPIPTVSEWGLVVLVLLLLVLGKVYYGRRGALR